MTVKKKEEILEYEGEYLYGIKWNGKGYDLKGNIIYELKNGCGNIKEYNEENFLVYEGEFLDGRRHGKGKEYLGRWFNYVVFEGGYLNGERNGKGKEFDIDGKIIYEGEYLNGERNGKGKEYDEEGKIIFEGEYINGEKLVQN